MYFYHNFNLYPFGVFHRRVIVSTQRNSYQSYLHMYVLNIACNLYVNIDYKQKYVV